MAEPIIRFGKHNGKPISEVPTPYLEWLSRENEDGTPRCQSNWFRGEVIAEIARRTGGNAHEPVEVRHAHDPVESRHEPVRVHHDAPPGSAQWMNQPKPNVDMQRLFTALAQINSKLDSVLVRLGDPVSSDEAF